VLGLNGVSRGGEDGKSSGTGGSAALWRGQDSRSVSRADLSPVIALSIVAWTYC
jgi:hypothetical protein